MRRVLLPLLVLGLGLGVPAVVAGQEPADPAMTLDTTASQATATDPATDALEQQEAVPPGEEAPADDPEPKVVAAAAGGVTIKDFQFGPASVSIKAGDSVSWTNQGPTAHTATANGGEFNSGLLQKGKSFSHTFTKAGTYTYYCQPHPFMKGTIVVTASSSSGSGGSSGSNSGTTGGSSGTSTTTPSTATPAAADTSGGLPNTGHDVAPWIFLGVSLIVFGAALHWRLRTE